MMKNLITICARGGSKGIPGKNIKSIAGKPLIAYSIECALKLSDDLNADIELSTDSDEIVDVCLRFGLHTKYRRPAELASDTAGKIPVLKDLLNNSELKHQKKYDYLIDLDVTSPMRKKSDVLAAFNKISADVSAYNIFSVSPANRNPYFNMVELKEDGFLGLVKDGSGFKRRQDAPPVYDMNASFYIYRRIFFEDGLNSAITPRSLVHVMNDICFDLDQIHDFLFMEFLILNGHYNFES
jgi:CMP-N-acetylneuraminic acid synthetase